MEVSMIEWVVFFAIVAILLFLDLFVIHRKNEHIPVRSALLQTAIWVSIALAFGVYVFIQHGADHAMEFYAAYVVEEAMSVDNLFVFILLFSMFGIKDEMQHKALFYGIIGAIVFRAIFIFVGSELLNRIDWMMYIFGILLVFLAFKTAFQKKDESKAPVAEWLSKHMNVSSDLDGGKFFTIENGKKIATPLLVCVLAIELTVPGLHVQHLRHHGSQVPVLRNTRLSGVPQVHEVRPGRHPAVRGIQDAGVQLLPRGRRHVPGSDPRRPCGHRPGIGSDQTEGTQNRRSLSGPFIFFSYRLTRRHLPF